ncbi:hypothetical protein AB833_10445 [Chromatiales bacterium (ex Bugula neritina AB1)]|nr:hypothetical protein AB833_10445 [Chromatiales bacterium (ex Bugula neritina AB1)]
MIIAGEFQPGLSVVEELGKIDRFVQDAESYPVVDAESLVEFMAGEQNFSGNSNQYYSVSNSLLNQVLATKKGIPITIAVVYLAIVERLSGAMRAEGISFPGHFLVRIDAGSGEQLIDPFAGQLVSRDECYQILAGLYGREVEPNDRFFNRAGSRQILRRILENLKVIHSQTGDAKGVLTCLDYQLMLYPDDEELLQQQQNLLDHLRENDGSHYDESPRLH